MPCTCLNDITKSRDLILLPKLFLLYDCDNFWRNGWLLQGLNDEQVKELWTKTFNLSPSRHVLCPQHELTPLQVIRVFAAIDLYKRNLVCALNESTGDFVIFDRRIERLIGLSFTGVSVLCQCSDDAAYCDCEPYYVEWAQWRRDSSSRITLLDLTLDEPEESDTEEADTEKPDTISVFYAGERTAAGVVYILRAIIACLVPFPLPVYVLAHIVEQLIGPRITKALRYCNVIGEPLSKMQLRKFRASGGRTGLVPIIENVKSMFDAHKHHRADIKRRRKE